MHHHPELPNHGQGAGVERLRHQALAVLLTALPQDVVAVGARDDVNVAQHVNVYVVRLRLHLIEPSGLIPLYTRHPLAQGGVAKQLLVAGVGGRGLVGGGLQAHLGQQRVVHADEAVVAVLLGRVVEHQSGIVATGQAQPGVAHLGRLGVAGIAAAVVGDKPCRHAAGTLRRTAPVGQQLHLAVLVGQHPQVATLAARQQPGHQAEVARECRGAEQSHHCRPKTIFMLVHHNPQFYASHQSRHDPAHQASLLAIAAPGSQLSIINHPFSCPSA